MEVGPLSRFVSIIILLIILVTHLFCCVITSNPYYSPLPPPSFFFLLNSAQKRQTRQSLRSSLSGPFSPGDDNLSSTAAGKRRTTASPGAIAFLASMLNNSENNVSGSKSEDYTIPQESDEGVAPSSPYISARASISSDNHRMSHGGMNGSEIGIVFDGASSRIAADASNRRQSILSPGMAALFGLDQPTVNVLNSSMQGSSSMSASAVAATTTGAGIGIGGGMKSGPGHRAKTPARSCMTAGKATGGEKTSRRGVIFGSPQAAEFTSDAAVADSLTNMDRSAVKARYKLGNEPELPFPSLYDMDLATSSSSVIHPDARQQSLGDNDDNDDRGSITSVESIETSKNSAQLAEWEEEVSHMESSASRAKRARESARAKARSSMQGDETGPAVLVRSSSSSTNENASSQILSRMASSPGGGSVASPESKRSRRSSTMGKRTAALDAVVAQVMAEDEEESSARNMDMSINEDSLQSESAVAEAPSARAVAAPPTPLRRSKRLEEETASISNSSSRQPIASHIDKSTMSVDALATQSSSVSRVAAREESQINDMSVSSPSPKPRANGSTPGRNVAANGLAASALSSSTPLFASSSPIPGPMQSLLASQISLKQQPHPQINIESATSSNALFDGIAGIVKAPIVISKSPDLGQRQKRLTNAAEGKRRVTLAVVPGLAHAQFSAHPPRNTRASDASIASSMQDESVDRTADTFEREALFAMLAEEDERSAAATRAVPGASTAASRAHQHAGYKHQPSSPQRPLPLVRASSNYDDLTAILGGSGSAVVFPSIGQLANRGGGGGPFGLSAFLDDDSTLHKSAMNDVTAALPSSLGSLLASEENNTNFEEPIHNSSKAASSHSNTQHLESSADAMMGTSEGDNTFASLDAVPREEADGSFAPNSPEFSFIAPTPVARTVSVNAALISSALNQQANRVSSSRTPSKSEIQSSTVSLQQRGQTPRAKTDMSVPTSPPTVASMPKPASILPPSSSSIMRQVDPPPSSSSQQPPVILVPSTNHQNVTASPRKAIASPAPQQAQKRVTISDIMGSAAKVKSNLPLHAPQPQVSVPAPFLFEDFCAVAGLRLFNASSSSSSSLSSAFDSISLPEPVFGAARTKSSKRRTSSIAQLARQSLISGRGARRSTASSIDEEGDEFTAMAASIITRSVLIPEREQIVGATDVLRKEIASVAPLLAAYVKDIDAAPPVAVREIARAQAIVSAFDLEGPSAVSDVEISRAQPLLARLRELKAMHELNASLVYLQWRADMAKQRLEALSKAKTSLMAESTSLEITFDAIRDANQKLESALCALEARGVKAMQASEGPMRASIEIAKAEKAALLNVAAQVAPAEAERAELASRRAALEARVKCEESIVAGLEVEAEKEKRSDGAYSGESAAAAVAIGAQAAKRYESLCAQTGFKVASVDMNTVSSSATVTLDFNESDDRVLKLTLLLKGSRASFVGLIHQHSTSSQVESAQVKIWREASVLEHYRSVSDTLADSLVSAVVEAEARGDPLVGHSLRQRITRLGEGLRSVASLCNEVVSLKESFPCRVSRATPTSPWTFSADLAAPAKKLKLRLQLDLDVNVETSYPHRAFKCTIIWVSGEQRLASSAVAHAVHKAQDDFLGLSASQRSGVIKAMVKACHQALRSM